MASIQSRKTSDRLGQTATVADATGTRTFTYNLAGTLEQQNEILPTAYFGDRRVTRGYDTSGRLNSTLGAYTYTYATNSHLLASISHSSSAWTPTRTPGTTISAAAFMIPSTPASSAGTRSRKPAG